MNIIHEVKINPSATEIGPFGQKLHALSNILLTPARYLFNGKTMTLYDIKYEYEGKGGEMHLLRRYQISQAYSATQYNVLKTAIAIVLLIPTTLLGAWIQYSLSTYSNGMNDIYNVRNATSKETPQDLFKEEMQVAICLADNERMKQLLHSLSPQDLNKFVNFYCQSVSVADRLLNWSVIDNQPFVISEKAFNALAYLDVNVNFALGSPDLVYLNSKGQQRLYTEKV